MTRKPLPNECGTMTSQAEGGGAIIYIHSAKLYLIKYPFCSSNWFWPELGSATL